MVAGSSFFDPNVLDTDDLTLGAPSAAFFIAAGLLLMVFLLRSLSRDLLNRWSLRNWISFILVSSYWLGIDAFPHFLSIHFGIVPRQKKIRRRCQIIIVTDLVRKFACAVLLGRLSKFTEELCIRTRQQPRAVRSFEVNLLSRPSKTAQANCRTSSVYNFTFVFLY